MPSPIRRTPRSPRDSVPGPAATTAVVAIGGNALTRPDQAGTHEEIAANSEQMAACLADLRARGWGVVAVHGNGPQVGSLAIQQAAANDDVPAKPLYALTAMTQGELGSQLVLAVDRICGPGTAVAMVTHVCVDENDPALSRPTKPIGPFYTAEAARRLTAERGWAMVEDAGRGFRLVVGSPAPVTVVELSAVRALVAAGHIVLAAGGGGVAVTHALRGIEGVIDKDLAAAAVATAIGADELYLLTGVDTVLLDYGTPRQRAVHRLTVNQARRRLARDEFAAGSMGPKVAAAIRFLHGGGRRVIITSAAMLAAAADGEPGAGTCIESAAPVAVDAR